MTGTGLVLASFFSAFEQSNMYISEQQSYSLLEILWRNLLTMSVPLFYSFFILILVVYVLAPTWWIIKKVLFPFV